MKQIPLYQHPFVDIFKVIQIEKWKNSEKSGDVTETIDKTLAKKIVKIMGPSNNTSFIQIPRSRSQVKSLGLIGKYVYIEARSILGKSFSLHLDYVIDEKLVTRISLSSIFKQEKSVNNTNIQIPFQFPPKWTILILDIKHILDKYKTFLPNSKESFYLRSLNISGNMLIRGIFTSDILYSLRSLPKEMGFRVGKGEEWGELYVWVQIPENDLYIQEKENIKNIKNIDNIENIENIKNIKNIKNIEGSKSKKAISKGEERKGNIDVREDLSEEERLGRDSSLERAEDQEEVIKAKNTVLEMTFGGEEGNKLIPEESNISEKCSEGIDRRNIYERERADMDVMSTLPKTTFTDLPNSPSKMRTHGNVVNTRGDIVGNRKRSLYREIRDKRAGYNNNINNTNNINGEHSEYSEYLLRPDPIMKLSHITGYFPTLNPSLLFSKNPKYPNNIYLSTNNIIIIQDSMTRKQEFLYGEELPITNMLNSIHYLIVITGIKENVISIWSLNDKSRIISFRTPVLKVITFDISSHQTYLSIAGKDHLNRDLILIYDLDKIIKTQELELVARQLSDFGIMKLKFNPIVTNSFTTVGKESIRIWRIKGGVIPGFNVQLNQFARDRLFLNLDYGVHDLEGEKKIGYIVACTKGGELFKVNPITRNIESVRKISNSAINCVCTSYSGKHISTVSENNKLELWREELDDKSKILELNNEAPVCTCSIHLYDESILMGSKNGSCLLLNLKTQKVSTLMRSHEDEIWGVQYNKILKSLISISKDNTIRVWNCETNEQSSQFDLHNEEPTDIHTHPLHPYFICSFKTGYLRIFDIQKAIVSWEYKITEEALLTVRFSPCGKNIATLDQSGKIYLFDASDLMNPQPFKVIEYNFPNTHYYNLVYSNDSCMLANISSNANTITIWETMNYSLKYELDLTGHIIKQIAFSPNNKDLIILTSTSRMKYFRLEVDALSTTIPGSAKGEEENRILPKTRLDTAPGRIVPKVTGILDIPGIHNYDVTSFTIFPNSLYMFVAGSDGVIKIFDYYFRGEIVPAFQAFYGHSSSVTKVICGDKEKIYSISKSDGIFQWEFYGNTQEDVGEDLFTKQLLSTQDKSKKIKGDQGIMEIGENDVEMGEEPALLPPSAIPYPTTEGFTHFDLNNEINEMEKVGDIGVVGTLDGRAKDMNIMNIIDPDSDPQKKKMESHISHIIGINNECKDNIIWCRSRTPNFLAYPSNSTVIIQHMNDSHSQTILQESSDIIDGVSMSRNKEYIAGYNSMARLSGNVCIYIWETATWSLVGEIPIQGSAIFQCDFSPNSNFLLVISGELGTNINIIPGTVPPVSSISLYDYKELSLLTNIKVDYKIRGGLWNPHLTNLEFSTYTGDRFDFWRITSELAFEYQKGNLGDILGQGSASPEIRCIGYSGHMKDMDSVLMILGLSNGQLGIIDTRTNTLLCECKLFETDVGVIDLYWGTQLLNVRTPTSYIYSCHVAEFQKCKKEEVLQLVSSMKALRLDGTPTGSYYNEEGTEGMISCDSGSIWYINWTEQESIKIVTAHNMTSNISLLQFKHYSTVNYTLNNLPAFTQSILASATTGPNEQALKFWDIGNYEQIMKISVTSEECLCVSFHPFMPYAIASFSDGFLRFIDLKNAKNMGRCQASANDKVFALHFLPNGSYIYCGSQSGLIDLIKIDRWEPLSITISTIGNTRLPIRTIDISSIEPYNKFLASSSGGKIFLYNRRNFNQLTQNIFSDTELPKFNLMDSFNLLEYVVNEFQDIKTEKSLNEYYNPTTKIRISNIPMSDNEAVGKLSYMEPSIYICFIKKSPNLFIRNYELHQIWKRIELNSMPNDLILFPNLPLFSVSLINNSVEIFDYVNPDNSPYTFSTPLNELNKMCLITQNRIITSGTGQIMIWNIEDQTNPKKTQN